MISLSMRGLAEVIHTAPAKRVNKLRKYKFKKSGESKGRSNYYVKALSIIKRHHRGDSAGRDQLLDELKDALRAAETSAKKAKIRNNIRVAESYLAVFGKRQFEVLKGVRLYFTFGSLVVSSQPDLIVQEHGLLKLIKLDCCLKGHPSAETMTMLHALYLAGRDKALIGHPAQVECLEVATHASTPGSKSHFSSSKTLENGCQEIIELWPTVTP